MNWSKLGKQFQKGSGILELMDDLGKAMENPDSVKSMLGGGNPASIPEVNELWRKRMVEIMGTEMEFENMLSNYDTPQGKQPFLKALAQFFQIHYHWPITEENIIVTSGSQQAFFLLFNFLAGESENGINKKIYFPMTPEYIGYADQLLDPGHFKAFSPKVELIGEHQFKYKIDFENLLLEEDCGALCVSRPTNPTGNVLSDEEMNKLIELTAKHNVPLIVDNAYGLPFPGVLFTSANIRLEPHMIFSMSLSKLGLPGVRTGILIANKEVIHLMSCANAVITLANTTVGQVLTTPLLEDGSILQLSKEVIAPYYRKKSLHAQNVLNQFFGNRFPWRVHLSEGAFFLWLWLPTLPITTGELYEKLKEQGVIVVPGQYFFFQTGQTHTHQDQCLRLSFIQSPEKVEEGVRIMADVIEKVVKDSHHQEKTK